MEKNKTIQTSATLKDKTIGIVGLGHLGASLARPLANGGFAKERLLISCRGSAETVEKAKTMGLEKCLTDTETLMASSDIIFIACRPQDLLSLPGDAAKEGALVVSCMAGLPLSLLSRFFRGKVVRMMCSGPDTISGGLGIAVTWPLDGRAAEAAGLMGIKLFDVGFEEELDSFTVGICIPPILLNADRSAREVERALGAMRGRFPVYARLNGWISGVMAAQPAGEKSACLENVMTKGGISESMFETLRRGGTFAEALERGLARGREITAEIRREVFTASALPDGAPAEKAG